MATSQCSSSSSRLVLPPTASLGSSVIVFWFLLFREGFQPFSRGSRTGEGCWILILPALLPEVQWRSASLRPRTPCSRIMILQEVRFGIRGTAAPDTPHPNHGCLWISVRGHRSVAGRRRSRRSGITSPRRRPSAPSPASSGRRIFS